MCVNINKYNKSVVVVVVCRWETDFRFHIFFGMVITRPGKQSLPWNPYMACYCVASSTCIYVLSKAT